MNQFIIKAMGAYINTLAIFSPRAAAKKSFKVFSTPIAPKIKEHQQAFLSQSEKFKIDFEGKKIQGYKWGVGEKKLFFFHGWQSHAFRWKSYVETLSHKDYTLYAFDGPAHGNSDGKTFTIPMYQRLIIQILDEIGQPYGVIGHSMGGFSSEYAFYERQDLSPQKMVVMGAPVLVNDFVVAFQKMLGLSNRVMTSMLSYFIEVLGHQPDFYNAKEFAKTQKAEGLIIHDVDDDTVPVADARVVAENWPNSTYWETKGFGHRLRDAEVVKRVIEFIEK